MKKLGFLLLAIVLSQICVAQTLSTEEQKLYNLIMEYRSEHNLPKIPLSKNLTIVAQTHVKDLQENRPDKGNCNSHSWSSKGKWTPCCYTSDHAQAQRMWSKPRELTSYTGNGYEIACTGSNNAQQALNLWKTSSGHNAVILNLNVWKSHPWGAIGIGIYGNYAVVWFGEETDDK
jgi:uncharacterized protein YkwD